MGQRLFGEVHWMTMEQLQNEFNQDRTNQCIHPPMLIGTCYEQRVYLSNVRFNNHMLMLGSQETGVHKLPLLAHLFQDFHDAALSLVFLNPTQELRAYMVERFSNTHEICEFSLAKSVQSIAYNPLSHVPLLDASTDKHAFDITTRQHSFAIRLARVWIEHTLLPISHSNDSFGIEMDIERIMIACILHLRATRPDAPFSALADLMTNVEGLEAELRASPSEFVRSCGTGFEYFTKDYQHILFAHLSKSAQPMLRKDMQERTAFNELDFSALLQRPIVLFYTPPESYATRATLVDTDGSRAHPMTAVFFEQMTATLAEMKTKRRRSIQKHGALDGDTLDTHGVRFVISQSEALGALPNLAQHISLWPQMNYTLSFVLAAESRASVSNLYGQDGAVILNEIGTHLLLPGATREDCETYSKYCGRITEHRQDVVGTDAHVIYRTIRKPLVTPEQLHSLKQGYAFLYPVGIAPAVIKLLDM